MSCSCDNNKLGPEGCENDYQDCIDECGSGSDDASLDCVDECRRAYDECEDKYYNSAHIGVAQSVRRDSAPTLSRPGSYEQFRQRLIKSGSLQRR